LQNRGLIREIIEREVTVGFKPIEQVQFFAIASVVVGAVLFVIAFNTS